MSGFKDLISYTFGILKYVVNNRQYYYNNQAYDFNIKIWGDSIGNMLRNEENRSINIFISNDSIITEFIKILDITKILTRTVFNDTTYTYLLNLNINNITYTIKINNILTYFSNNDIDSCYSPKIYATCENLCIDINGNINTVIPCTNTNYSDNSAGWVMRCINDSIHKKFRLIIVKPILELHNLISINEKYDNLLLNGYEYNDENITTYSFIKLQTYKDIGKYTKNASAGVCVICHESYNENNNSILLGCMHDFHIDCLQKWIDSKKNTSSNASCPFCRKNITFDPNATYGNPEIDTIISNINLPEIIGNLSYS